MQARACGAAALLLALAACAIPGGSAPATRAAPVAATAPLAAPAVAPVGVVPRILARFPHDPAAFTEGLIAEGDTLVESTGGYAMSDVRRVRLADGAVLMRRAIARDQFGEGLARRGDELVSLTWRSGIAHRWRASDLSPLGDFRYAGEGWGLTSGDEGYVLSDGSATLRVLDPADFHVLRTINVTANGRPIDQINELEMVGGHILANIWMTPLIVAIDPASGRVTHVIDCRALVEEAAPRGDDDAVLNGIAWDAQARRLFVTGKNWPTLFEIAVPGLTEAD